MKKLFFIFIYVLLLYFFFSDFIHFPRRVHIGFNLTDKYFHFLFWFFSNLFFTIFIYRYSFIFLFGISIGIEYLQKYIWTHRSFDLKDIESNFYGIILSTLLVVFFYVIIRSHKSSIVRT